MKLTLLERSECFRGFLLLIAQDRVISPEERDLLRHIGKTLDFERGFCEEAIDELLENTHISKSPPVFSRQEYAEAFLLDCIRIAGADHEIHPDEMTWLTRIAEANGLPDLWVKEVMQKVRAESAGAGSAQLQIAAYI